MKPASKNKAPKRLNQPSQRPRTEIPSRSVFGFPILVNQFQSLQESTYAVSTSQGQSEDRLINSRTTRLARQRAARRIAGQGTFGNVSNEGIFQTIPPGNDAQGIFDNGERMETVASTNKPKFFPNFLSVSAPDVLETQPGGNVQNLLEIGVVSDDALYISNVNYVACTDGKCNKRISYVGPERSAGRPGIRPFGASSAACPSPNTACLGAYGTAYRQPHRTGPNTREEIFTASSTTGRP